MVHERSNASRAGIQATLWEPRAEERDARPRSGECHVPFRAFGVPKGSLNWLLYERAIL